MRVMNWSVRRARASYALTQIANLLATTIEGWTASFLPSR
jgi:hypothetical protein